MKGRSAYGISKSDQIKYLIVCEITETWFTTAYHPKSVTPPGYTVQHVSRDH